VPYRWLDEERDGGGLLGAEATVLFPDGSSLVDPDVRDVAKRLGLETEPGPDLKQNGKFGHDWPLDRDPYMLETSKPGVFVAGDVRKGSIKRLASAVGEGAMAVQFVHLSRRERATS